MQYFRFLIAALCCLPFAAYTQSISGYILSNEGEALPFANIYIEENGSGTATDINGYYSFNFEVSGEYHLVISSLGYESQTLEIVVDDSATIRDFKLNPSSVELEEIIVKASKRDPAYAIIKKASEHKKAYLASIESYRTNVYIKATEVIEETERAKKKREQKEAEKEKKKTTTTATEDGEVIDPFEAEEKRKKDMIEKLSMVEMEVLLNYQYPKKYKEERTAYNVYGKKHGLFIPRFEETDFNFYRNMVFLTGIAEVPVISPISTTAILSYKYKLIQTFEENGHFVYKIKVIPRKAGNATCKGYIYINDETWNINRLDLELSKGALRFFDRFRLKQNYQHIEDSLWIPQRQEFIYETKYGRSKIFKGNTTLSYSDYEHNYDFPPKFFGNEVVLTTKEAYDRDSVYWSALRPEPLTLEQQKVVSIRDSIDRVYNSKEYKDSIQAKYNKVTFYEVVWDGMGFQNHEKKQHIYVGSIPALLDFEIVGGFRLGPFVDYFKRWENYRRLSVGASVNIGLRNKDVQGNCGGRFRYDPHRLGDIRWNFGRSFASINEYDAYLNQLRSSNYILHDIIELGHRIELLNGLYLDVYTSYSNRKSIVDYNTSSFISDWDLLNDLIGAREAVPIDFDGYQAFITDTRISYTPAQKFMTEPRRKIILNSPFPTFTFFHQRGWKNVFSSDIDFDYLEFNIRQNIIVGAFGSSKYNLKAGRFFNTKELKFIDLKRFRQSDPYLLSNPLHSFQALDTALNTTKLFLEGHYIHHFNGTLMNLIPFMHRTKIRTIAGASALWVKEDNYRHFEALTGIERVFKLGPRRRLRLGVYGVFATSNHTDPAWSYKFSIDIIDTWKRNWSF